MSLLLRTFLAFQIFLIIFTGLLGQVYASEPIANAGDDFVAEKGQLLGREVLVDGTYSFDPDGDILTYHWYGPFPEVSGGTPNIYIPEGSYTVSLLVNDGTSRSECDEALITIEPAFNLSTRAMRDQVQLIWDVQDGVEVLRVYRFTDMNPVFELISEAYTDYGAYLDTTVVNEITYLYVIGSYLNGRWCYSNVASSHPTTIRSRTPINYAPLIYSSPIEHGMSGITYNYDVNATDPNHDSLTYTLVTFPAGMNIDAATGLIAWVPPDEGSFDIEVQVSDVQGETDTQSYTLVVGELPPLNQPPIADAGGPYTGIVDQEITFDGSGSYDPDGDDLVYEWDFGDGTTGEGVMPVHSYAGAGTYLVTLVVSDIKSLAATVSTTAIVYQPPAVSISAEPDTIILGDSSVLTWSAEDAHSVSIDNGIGVVEPNGSVRVEPIVTTTYTINAAGPGGESTDSCTITVYYPPTVSIEVHPENIIAGSSATLEWSSTNANMLVIDNDIGNVSSQPGGSRVVSPMITTTYNITAAGSGGSAADSTTITVSPLPNVSISAEPGSIIAGGSATISWTSENVSSVSIDNGVGIVDCQGSIEVSPLVTTSYTAAAVRSGCAVYDSTTVIVLNLPVVSIGAEPATIIEGESSTITWNTENATAVSLDNGIGTVDLQGSLQVSPVVTTTYTATAISQEGTGSDSVVITVLHVPTVNLTANPIDIIAGTSTILAWSSLNADNVTIDNDIGAVDGNGSRLVSPEVTTTYVITASGPGGTATDMVTVNVYQQPIVSISASPNPIYTGEATILSWTSTGADTAIINQGIGQVNSIGSMDVNLLETTTYTITATGVGGTATDSVIVVVNEEQAENFGYAYITNGESDDVSVVDLETNTVVERISVGQRPYGVEVSPDSEKVYVTCEQGGIFVIDTATNTVMDNISITASCIAVSPDCATVYAVSPFENAVIVIDASSNTVTNMIGVGMFPHGIAMSPDGSTLYVTNMQDGSVSIIDVVGNCVMDMVLLGQASFPIDIEITPDGSSVYVACLNESTVRVIDSVTNTLKSSINMNHIPDINSYPRYIAISPDGLYAYVNCESGYLFVIDTSTQDIIDYMDLGEGISDISIIPGGEYMYIPNAQSNCVHVVDAAARKVSVTLDEDFGQPYTCGHFIAVKKFRVNGRIVSSSDAMALVGVRLTLLGEDIVKTDVTDAQGQYSFAVPNGSYTINASRQGYIFAQDTMTVVVNNGDMELPVIEVSLGVDISADPDAIISGEAAVLTWDSINATRVSMDNGIGDVDVSGLLTVSPEESTTYAITVENDEGQTARSSIIVAVHQIPTTNIIADSYNITTGQSAVLSWNSTDAYEVSIDNTIGRVVPNGTITVYPEQTTTYTITATGYGGTVTDTVTITVTEPRITITFPAGGSSINRPDTQVRGTINHTLTEEIGVTVNDVPASVFDNEFVANHVGLSDGENTIVVRAADTQGNTAGATITVYSEVDRPYILVSVDKELGVCPVETTLNVEPALSPDIISISYVGPGQVDLLETAEDGEYRVSIVSEGVYTFTAEATTESGDFTDTVSVLALDRETLDSLLRAKWEGMRTALANNEIDAAANFFINAKRENKRSAFSMLSESRRLNLVQELDDIEFIKMMERSVEYDIRIYRDETEYSFYLLFEMDDDGLWKIRGF